MSKAKTLSLKIMKARLQTERAKKAEAELEAYRSQVGATDMQEQLEANRMYRSQAAQEAQEEKRLKKEQQRPSRALWPEVFWEAHKEKWTCEHSGVVAYGDSPEMACENFDRLWVFGHGKT
jgi:rubrerythrin